MKLRGLSLHAKIFLALTVIPASGFAAFVALGMSSFASDKIGSSLSSSLTLCKTRAAHVNSDLSSILSLTQALVLNYRTETQNLSEAGTESFEREPRLLGFQLYIFNERSGQYDLALNLSKDKKPAIDKNNLLIRARAESVVVEALSDTANSLLLGARFGEANDPRHVIAVTQFESSDLAQIFNAETFERPMLIKKTGAATLYGAVEMEKSFDSTEIWNEIAKLKLPEGSTEMKSAKGNDYLVAFSDVGLGDLVVLSVSDKAALLAGGQAFQQKAYLLFAALLSLLIVTGIVLSREFKAPIVVTAFTPTGELNNETSQKEPEPPSAVIPQILLALVEAEKVIKLAEISLPASEDEPKFEFERLAQKPTFKPRKLRDVPQIEIEITTPVENNDFQVGLFRGTDRSPGDFAYTFESEENLFVWMGTTMGSVPPTFLTRIALSALNENSVPVTESIELINRILCETFEGRGRMTLFAACIDRAKNVMTYVNAGHIPPLVLRDDGTKYAELSLPNAVNTKSLGSDIEARFTSANVYLLPKDKLVFATKGFEGKFEAAITKEFVKLNSAAEPSHRLEEVESNTRNLRTSNVEAILSAALKETVRSLTLEVNMAPETDSAHEVDVTSVTTTSLMLVSYKPFSSEYKEAA